MSTTAHRKFNPYRTNAGVAAALLETAELLELQGANPFRTRAYRHAAETVAATSLPLWRTVATEGLEGLSRLPTIGRSIAAAIAQMTQAGKFPLLERLRGDEAGEPLFATVADIGPKLAHRIHEQLGIETLWELAAAAKDGRLARVRGFGPKRVRAVRESLAGRFRLLPSEDRQEPSETERRTPISEILEIDREYRQGSSKGALPRIAPRRFNPHHETWLPVLHTERRARHYSAMFSNSARAHELGATHDWVVIYRDDEHHHGQWTVITSRFGHLKGQRIVCGREEECEAYYASRQTKKPTAKAATERQLTLI